MPGLIVLALCPGISRPTIADLRVNRIRNSEGVGGWLRGGWMICLALNSLAFLGTFSGTVMLDLPESKSKVYLSTKL